jgi:hypothetical protein
MVDSTYFYFWWVDIADGYGFASGFFLSVN